MLSVIAINLIIATSLTGRVSYFTIILQYINIPDWTGENFSANQRPGRPSYLSDRPEKHKSCRVRLDVAVRFR